MRPMSPGSVLVVSADPSVGEPIRQALYQLGCSSLLASTSVEAIHRLSDDAPRAVIVDALFQDEMDPMHIVHRALACRETHGAAVVVLAGEAEQVDRDELLAGGCTAVLARSTDPHDVARVALAR